MSLAKPAPPATPPVEEKEVAVQEEEGDEVDRELTALIRKIEKGDKLAEVRRPVSVSFTLSVGC